jgi:putative hydrolase of the HAD superfamily
VIVLYRFVLFDVGGTLLGPRESFGAVYARSLVGSGLAVDAKGAQSGLEQTMHEMEQLIPAGSDRYRHFPGGEDEFWLRFAHRTLELATGSPIEARAGLDALERIRRAFLEPEAWHVFPDVRPTLEALRGHGVKLGIVSNWDSRLPGVLDMLDLSRYFDFVGVSHFEGVEKPDPEIFHRVLARLGGRPEETLHVGDLPEIDRAGAEAAGCAAVLIDRRGALAPGPGVIDDLRSLL